MNTLKQRNKEWDEMDRRIARAEKLPEYQAWMDALSILSRFDDSSSKIIFHAGLHIAKVLDDLVAAQKGKGDH